MGERCEQFKNYLDSAGAINALTKTFNKLFNMNNRPDEPIEFLSEELSQNYSKIIADLKEKLTNTEAAIQVYRNDKMLHIEDNGSIKAAIDRLLSSEKCNSLLKKHITKEKYDLLEKESESSLAKCIKIGLIDHSDDIGVVAVNAECYKKFDELFNPIISEYHGVNKVKKSSWEEGGELTNLDEQFIMRGVITCKRNFLNFPFQTDLDKGQLDKLHQKIIEDVLNKIKDDSQLKGVYYEFEKLDTSTSMALQLLQNKQIFDENSFDETSKILGATNEWPIGRGAHISNDNSFIIWVNHLDHLEYKSIQNDGKMNKLYDRITYAGKLIDKLTQFAENDELGFLTRSPKDIGNGMKVSIFLKLSKLPLNKSRFDKLLEMNGLVIGDTEISDDNSLIIEVQNKSSLGNDQFITMKGVLEGIEKIIAAEKKLYVSCVDEN